MLYLNKSKKRNVIVPDNETPAGQRFSHLYLQNEDILRDCPRMRRRVASAISDCFGDNNDSVSAGSFLEAELGIGITSVNGYHVFVDWKNFLGNCELRDFLDVVTLIYRLAIQTGRQYRFRGYQESISRIFRECNVGYRLDDQCGVHPFVDAAFENSRANAISGIGGERFSAAREHLEQVELALMIEPPDSRQAIRFVFDAAENIFKMMFGGVTHINKAAIRDNLRPRVEANYTGQPAVKNTMLKLCDGFNNWVEAAHFFRHANGQPEPAQPPQELMVLMISQGYGWVRWLAELDQAIHANGEEAAKAPSGQVSISNPVPGL